MRNMTIATPKAAPTLKDLYGVIWRYTRRDQILLIVLALAVSALAVFPLKFQQLAINSMVEHSDVATLAWLCAGYFGAVVVGALAKFILSYRRSVLGERTVRILRDRLHTNYVDDAAGDRSKLPKRGSMVMMITSEAEAVGTFAGDAIATPLVLIGTLASVLGFIAISQPLLGLVAFAVVLPQVFVVIHFQRRINKRVSERVQALRDASDRLSESDLSGIDGKITKDFDDILGIRSTIFFLKQSTKFLLRSMSAIGSLCFLFLGGLFVLRGQTDVGTVVASLTGLARIDSPWRELIGFFRSASTVRVQFGMLLKALARGASGSTG